MKRFLVFMVLLTAGGLIHSQQIDNIYFNLYTDSLKKGFYNYISVDGKYSDGHWLPLDSSQVTLRCNTGFFRGNDLFIDSSYAGDKVSVKAVLKSNPAIWKETTIYIRKRPFTEPLPTNEEIIYDTRKKRKKEK